MTADAAGSGCLGFGQRNPALWPTKFADCLENNFTD